MKAEAELHTSTHSTNPPPLRAKGCPQHFALLTGCRGHPCRPPRRRLTFLIGVGLARVASAPAVRTLQSNRDDDPRFEPAAFRHRFDGKCRRATKRRAGEVS